MVSTCDDLIVIQWITIQDDPTEKSTRHQKPSSDICCYVTYCHLSPYSLRPQHVITGNPKKTCLGISTMPNFNYANINNTMVLCEFTAICDHNPSDICHLSIVIGLSCVHGLVIIDIKCFYQLWLPRTGEI